MQTTKSYSPMLVLALFDALIVKEAAIFHVNGNIMVFSDKNCHQGNYLVQGWQRTFFTKYGPNYDMLRWILKGLRMIQTTQIYCVVMHFSHSFTDSDALFTAI